jgi:hypothetical protein
MTLQQRCLLIQPLIPEKLLTPAMLSKSFRRLGIRNKVMKAQYSYDDEITEADMRRFRTISQEISYHIG